MVDLRINETLQTGAVRRPHLPFCRLVGTVSNSADAVRLETAPTGPDKSGSKPRGESVYLFLDFTIIAPNLCANCIISVGRFSKIDGLVSRCESRPTGAQMERRSPFPTTCPQLPGVSAFPVGTGLPDHSPRNHLSPERGV